MALASIFIHINKSVIDIYTTKIDACVCVSVCLCAKFNQSYALISTPNVP